jgi:hypothetical protein
MPLENPPPANPSDNRLRGGGYCQDSSDLCWDTGGYLQVVMIAPTSGEALKNVVRKMACWHPKHSVEYFVEFRGFRERLNV